MATVGGFNLATETTAVILSSSAITLSEASANPDRLLLEGDSASALRQIGYLPAYVPYTGPAIEGKTGDKPLELRLPAMGIDTASKMRDKNSVPSNVMFGWGVK